MKKLTLWFFAFILAVAPALADNMPLPWPLSSATRTVVSVAGASKTLLVANQGRKAFCVVNYVAATESIWIDYGVAALVGSSQEVPAGATLCFGGSTIWQGLVTVNATTNPHQVTVYEFN